MLALIEDSNKGRCLFLMSHQCYINIQKVNLNLSLEALFRLNLAGIYLFNVNNRNIRTMCEVCSKLTMKTLERRQRCSGVFIVNFEHMSQPF